MRGKFINLCALERFFLAMTASVLLVVVAFAVVSFARRFFLLGFQFLFAAISIFLFASNSVLLEQYWDLLAIFGLIAPALTDFWVSSEGMAKDTRIAVITVLLIFFLVFAGVSLKLFLRIQLKWSLLFSLFSIINDKNVRRETIAEIEEAKIKDLEGTFHDRIPFAKLLIPRIL